MTKLKWPPPDNPPVGWSIPYITGYPQPKRAPKRPFKETTFAQKHRWSEAQNWGIAKPKPNGPKPYRERTTTKRRRSVRKKIATAKCQLVLVQEQIAALLAQKGTCKVELENGRWVSERTKRLEELRVQAHALECVITKRRG